MPSLDEALAELQRHHDQLGMTVGQFHDAGRTTTRAIQPHRNYALEASRMARASLEAARTSMGLSNELVFERPDGRRNAIVPNHGQRPVRIREPRDLPPPRPDPGHEALIDGLRAHVKKLNASGGQDFRETIYAETRKKALLTIKKLEDIWQAGGESVIPTLVKSQRVLHARMMVKRENGGDDENQYQESQIAPMIARAARAFAFWSTIHSFQQMIAELNEVKEKYGGRHDFAEIKQAAAHWKNLFEEAVEKADGSLEAIDRLNEEQRAVVGKWKAKGTA